MERIWPVIFRGSGEGIMDNSWTLQSIFQCFGKLGDFGDATNVDS